MEGEDSIRKKRQTRLAVKEKRIAVSGVEHRVGTTHFCILLGIYYKRICGKKVCLVDISTNHALTGLEEEIGSLAYRNLGVQIFGDRNRERQALIEDAGKVDADVWIYDTGVMSEGAFPGLAMCDKRIVVGNCAPWDYASFQNEIERHKEIWDDRVVCAYTFGDNGITKSISEVYGTDIRRIPYVDGLKPDPLQLAAIGRVIR